MNKKMIDESFALLSDFGEIAIDSIILQELSKEIKNKNK